MHRKTRQWLGRGEVVGGQPARPECRAPQCHVKGRTGTNCNGPWMPASKSRCFSVGKRELLMVWQGGGV